MRPTAVGIAAMILVATAALTLAPARQAVAQDPDRPTPMSVEVQRLETILSADDPEAQVRAQLLLEAGEDDRDDLRLVTTVHTRVESLTDLRAAEGGDLPPVFSAVSDALPDMPAGTVRVITPTVDRTALSLPPGDRGAVHPLQYQVFQGGDLVASVITTVVVLPTSTPAPLPASTVLRMHSSDVVPMVVDAPSDQLLALLAPDSGLRPIIRDLRAAAADGSAAGITLALESRLLEDIRALTGGLTTPDGIVLGPSDRLPRRAAAILDQLRQTAARADTEVLAMPYGLPDLVALVRGGQERMALELVELGVDRLAEVMGAPARRDILLPPDGIDSATLAALGPADASALLLDERYLAFAEQDLPEPVRRLRTADGGEVRLLVPDAHRSLLLQDPAGRGTAIAVQQLLADTAVQWLVVSEGGDADTAGLLVALDVLDGLPDDLIATATDAISRAPWLRPMALSTLDDTLRPSSRVVRLAYPPRSAASELDRGYIDRLGRAATALDSLGSLVAEGTDVVGGPESLLSTASVAFRDRTARPIGLSRIEAVLTRLDDLSQGVQIVQSAPITLTATTGEVPVTLSNTGEAPVRLRVTLSSTRFDFPQGDTRELVLQGGSSQQLRFAAEALNPGGFAAIGVIVTDPTGDHLLTETRISVRSTAFPVVGLIAVIGSAVVLLAWGIRQPGRRRWGGRRDPIDDVHQVA